MNITTIKTQIIQWINSLEDEAIIDEIFALKSGKISVREFDFDSAWSKSVPVDEAREKSEKYIKALPWKK